MTFDLSKVQQQAQEVKESNVSSDYKYPIVYTQSGTISLRLLFNPKSGVVMRLIKRHWIGKDRIACLSNYGQQCPICSAVEEAEAVTGSDLWKMKANNRCIFFAQYVGSNYNWSEKYPQPKEGSIILVMAPWSVYSSLNSLIAESGDNVTKLLTDVEGAIVDIRREDSGRVTYTTGLKPFSDPYKSANTQEEFDALLESLDNLNDLIIPTEISEDIINAANQVAITIRGEYVSPRVISNSSNAGVNLGQYTQTQSQQSIWDQTAPVAQPINQPSEVASFDSQSDLLPKNGDTKINPVTGQVYSYQNGSWVETGEVQPTDMNGGLNG